MAIAEGFGACSVFTVFTPNVGFPAYNEFTDSFDFERFYAEPRPTTTRLTREFRLFSGHTDDELDMMLKNLEDLSCQLGTPEKESCEQAQLQPCTQEAGS